MSGFKKSWVVQLNGGKSKPGNGSRSKAEQASEGRTGSQLHGRRVRARHLTRAAQAGSCLSTEHCSKRTKNLLVKQFDTMVDQKSSQYKRGNRSHTSIEFCCDQINCIWLQSNLLADKYGYSQIYQWSNLAAVGNFIRLINQLGP